MPTKLYRFETLKQLLIWCEKRGYSLKACREAWTGPGYYYARSRKKISKHVPHLDKRRGRKIGEGPYRHVHDKPVKAVVKLAKTTRKTVKAVANKIAKKLEISQRKVEKALTLQAVKQLRRREIPESVKRLANRLWRRIPDKYKEGKNRIWTYVSVLALAKTIYKHARDSGIDWESMDWESIDWSLTYREAKAEVLKLLGASGSSNYDDVPEEEIVRRLKELEEYRREELDPVKEWELRSML